jgi:hypothetical protein
MQRPIHRGGEVLEAKTVARSAFNARSHAGRERWAWSENNFGEVGDELDDGDLTTLVHRSNGIDLIYRMNRIFQTCESCRSCESCLKKPLFIGMPKP